jgi:uncharacterized membrane protein YeaQ/YmgE (transglycosylase-associated protein family)
MYSIVTICGTIIFGALVGWVASLITGRKSQSGCLTNIILGILGAFFGTFLLNLFLPGERPVLIGFDCTSLIVAVFGAVVLVGLFRLIRGK